LIVRGICALCQVWFKWSPRSTHLCFWHSFDDVMRINFRFRLLLTWSSPHGRDTSSHKIWCRYLYSVRSYWHFSEIQAAAILDFQVMWIWPFRYVDSVVFVLRTKFGSNICYCNWDRHTYPSDIHLMTSRELTSGLDFWSRGHLHMAVMHLTIKFGADKFI